MKTAKYRTRAVLTATGEISHRIAKSLMSVQA